MIQRSKINGVTCDVYEADSRVDDIYAAYGAKMTIKQLAATTGANVAGNLPYAEYKVTGLPIGHMVVDGKDVTQMFNAKTLNRDSLYMMPDGTMHIGRPPAGAPWSLQGSPPLLEDGIDVVDDGIKRDQLGTDIWKNDAKHIRIAYGLKSPYELVIVRTRANVTLKALAAIMAALGCVDAINGDGGGSTTLYPADSGNGRKLGAALCIKEGVRDMGKLTIKQYLIPKGRGNRPGHAMKAEWITVHLTGNKAKTADAANHAEYLAVNPKSAAAPVSWHFTVDDKLAYQHLPTNESGWHAGDSSSGPGNRKSIGIEVCENEGINQAKAWLNAAELTAQLMFEQNLPITAVVQHNKWSGKNCPQDLRANGGAGWAKFIADVKKARAALDPLPDEKPITVPGPFSDVPGNHWSAGAVEWAKDIGIAQGYPDGSLGFGENITIERQLVLLHRLYQLMKEVK